MTVFKSAFPQWAAAVLNAEVSHYFQCYDAFGVSRSLCGRVHKNWQALMLPASVQHCKDCERQHARLLERQGAIK